MKQSPKKESLVLGKLLKQLGPTINAKVVLEPEWGIAGQITFQSGKRCYFRYNTLDLNPVGASDIAKDKDYANYFLRLCGYPTIPGSKTFFSDAWASAIGAKRRRIDNAYVYAKTLVAIVYNKREFHRAMRAIFKQDRVGLVQQVVRGKDYRVVVLDRDVISAYERTALHVVGDDKSSIKQLVAAKQAYFLKTKRGTCINLTDPRIEQKLKRQSFSWRSTPANGEKVFLLDNANLSTGGDSLDVTNRAHPSFKELAIQITYDMGLRLCGVDLIIDGDISLPPVAGQYWVVEINAAPGLDHYAKVGRDQTRVVENLYRQVLQSLDVAPQPFSRKKPK
nr:RimK-like ATP-grasp domain protein [uncultured bacterium]